MTIVELISYLKVTALNNPLVRTWVDDIEDVSSYSDLKYGVIALEQGTSDIDNKGWITWNGSLYYINRVFDSPSDSVDARREDNHIEVQSQGIIVLHNLVKNLTEVGMESATYQVFTHRFRDLCAGAQVQLTLRFPLSICWDDFDAGEYYNVVVNATNGTVTGAGRYRKNSVCILTFYPAVGYHFDHWSDGNTQNPRQIVVMNDVTLSVDGVVTAYVIDASAVHGSVTGSGTYYYGDTCTLTVTPDEGYKFVAWDDGSTDNPRVFEVTESKTLTTECIPLSQYVISVTAEHGTTTGSGTYQEGAVVQIGVTPDFGYHFVQWMDGNTDNPRSITVTESKVYSTACQPNEYVVTATSEHGSIAGTGTYHYGDTCTLTMTPALGYRFTQWSDGDTNNPKVFVVTDNVNLVAYTEQIEYTVSVSASHGTATGGGVFHYGDVCTLEFTPSEHYHFEQWSDGNRDNPRSFTVVDNVSLTVSGVLDRFTITASGHYGTITGAGTYDYGTTCTLTFVPSSHYHFDHWVDGDYPNPRSFTVTADASFEAYGAIDRHSVTVTAVHGTPSGSGTYDYGAEVVISVVPDSEYYFERWNDGNTENPRTVIVTGDVTYSTTCVQVPTYVISVDAYNGTVTGAGTYHYGDTCTLTFTPAEHYHFSVWTDGNPDNPRVFTVTGDASFSVIGQIDTHTISTNAVNGQITGGGVFNYGETCTLTFYPNSHYHFTQWTDGSTSNPRSFQVLSDGSYACTGVIDQHTISASAVHGSVSGAGTYDYGSSVVLTVTPDSGYRFDHWSDGDINNPRTVTVLGDASYSTECVVAGTYLLSISGMHYDISSVNCTVNGSAVTLPAYVAAGATVKLAAVIANTRVAEWLDREGGSVVCGMNPYIFAMPSNDYSVYANSSSYNGAVISVGVNDVSLGSAKQFVNGFEMPSVFTLTPGAGSVDVTFQAYPLDGNQFDAWSDGSTSNPVVKTLVGDADVTMTATLSVAVVYRTVTFSCEHGSVGATVDGIGIQSPAQVAVGKLVVFTITADEGYEYTGTNPETVAVGSEDITKAYVCTEVAAWTGLKFIPVDGTATMQWKYKRASQLQPDLSKTIEYSVDRGVNWVSLTASRSVTPDPVTFTDELWVRGDNTTYSNANTTYGAFIGFAFTGNVSASGNIMSMIQSTGFESLTGFTANYVFGIVSVGVGITGFAGLFSGCISLQSAPVLPATTLTTGCYTYMFYGCTSLTSAPALPSTTLTAWCYRAMFQGCTSLTTPPALPATTLAVTCYSDMFRSCTSLASAPALPSTTLANYCYQSMFYGCTSLTSVPSLPADEMNYCCYEYMFMNCIRLVNPPALSATSLNSYCYHGMFYGCTSLTSAPALPSTTLASSCYQAMFNGCTNLTGPVSISATSPYYEGTSSACTEMFTNAGTAEGTGGTIYVGGDSSLWNSSTAGITSPHTTRDWDVIGQGVVYHTVSFSCSNGSVAATVDGVGIQSGQQVAFGKSVVFTITPDSGYEYTGTNPETVVVTGDITKAYVCTVIPYLSMTGTGLNVYLANIGSNNPNCEYSVDCVTWTRMRTDRSSPLTLSSTPTYFRGTNSTGFSHSSSNYSYFEFIETGSGTPEVYCSGSVQSLYDGVGTATYITGDYCFTKLFSGGREYLKSVPALPATILANNCYQGMFQGCTSLISTPTLPATTLAQYCYQEMFYGCTSLISSPDLPATNLAQGCYYEMFQGCTSLVNVPETLPATTVPNAAYYAMFYGCTSLVTAPALPATTVIVTGAGDTPYGNMFGNCTHLEGPVNIAATSPIYEGYIFTPRMFSNSGTARVGTNRIINVGGNVSQWNYDNCGIDSNYWTVQQMTEEVDEQ